LSFVVDGVAAIEIPCKRCKNVFVGMYGDKVCSECCENSHIMQPTGPLDLVAYLQRGMNRWNYHYNRMVDGFNLLKAAERDD